MAREYDIPFPIPERGLIVSETAYFEDFEGGFQYYRAGIGAGYDVYKQPGIVMHGNYAAKAITRKVGAAIGDQIIFSKSIPLWLPRYLAITFAFYINDDRSFLEIQFVHPSIGGYFECQPYVKIDCQTGEIFIQDENLDYVPVGTLQSIGTYVWNYGAIEIDTVDRKVTKVKLAEESLSPNQKYYMDPTGQQLCSAMGFQMTSKDAWQKILYIDHYLIRPRF